MGPLSFTGEIKISEFFFNIRDCIATKAADVPDDTGREYPPCIYLENSPDSFFSK